MPARLLHHVRISPDSQRSSESTLASTIAAQGLLDGGGTAVESLSLDQDQRILEATIKGQYAEMVASEIEELFTAGADDVVYCSPDGSPEDGYYVLEEGTFQRASTHTDRVQQISGTVRHAGTKNRHWRALTTSQSQVDHAEEWGNETTATVTLPAAASKVQWFADETATRASASPASTRTADFGDVDVYDLSDGEAAVGADNPTLIYEIPYTTDTTVGLRVYDTLGYDATYDADGYRQWMVISRRQHDFDDAVVLDSGTLRVELDESSGTIAAQRWGGWGGGDYGAGTYGNTEAWADVALSNDSAWALYDVDITDIGMVRAEAQLTFSDGADLYALDAIVTRGAEDVLFAIPDGEEPPVPPAIVDWLDPIAASTLFDTGERKGLVSRQEVRR